jgi:hypothetical protein
MHNSAYCLSKLAAACRGTLRQQGSGGEGRPQPALTSTQHSHSYAGDFSAL